MKRPERERARVPGPALTTSRAEGFPMNRDFRNYLRPPEELELDPTPEQIDALPECEVPLQAYATPASRLPDPREFADAFRLHPHVPAGDDARPVVDWTAPDCRQITSVDVFAGTSDETRQAHVERLEHVLARQQRASELAEAGRKAFAFRPPTLPPSMNDSRQAHGIDASGATMLSALLIACAGALFWWSAVSQPDAQQAEVLPASPTPIRAPALDDADTAETPDSMIAL
jgi:hypothetical protein